MRATSGMKEGVTPLPFFESWKSVLILEKHALIVFIYGYLGAKTPKVSLVGPFFRVL